MHGRPPPSVSLFTGTTSQDGTAPVPLTMSLPDPKVKQMAHLQSEWTVCRDSSRGQEIMELGRLAPRHQHQRQTEGIRRWGRKWTLSGNMELPLVWNSPEGGWKAKRAATPCWSAQPGRQKSDARQRRRRADNVNVKQAFQLTAANKCHLISSLINKTLAKGVRTSIIILSNIQTTQSAQFTTVTHTIRTHCSKGLWCCANSMHSSKACKHRIFNSSGPQRTGPCQPFPVQVKRAATLYLCRASCLRVLSWISNHFSSQSLIYTHSHLGPEHNSTTVFHCSPVRSSAGVLEKCKFA